MERKLLGIDVIRIDGDTQSRDEINQALIAEYAEHMEEGAEFPAVLVFFDGVSYWLADGFHRYFANKKINSGSILADVREGTSRDAWLYSLGANSKHGMRRSNADKHKSVQRALADVELQDWSNAEIARQCGVSDRFVAKIRGDSAPDVRKFKMADGTIAEKRAPKKAENPEPEPVAAEPVVDADHEQMEMIAALVAENERITDRLGVAAMDGTEEEKAIAAETIEGLREEVRILKIELAAVKQSRDQYQSQAGQLIQQVKMLTRQLKKLGG